MKSIEVKGNLREAVGKTNAKEIRKNEEVPCVLYGKGENVHFKLTEKSFKELIFSPNSYLVNLDIEGKKYNAVLRDRQFHPISDKIIHADFYQIDEKSPIWIEVPVVLEGVSEGVLKGGKLEQKLRKLKIKALVKNIPDDLKVDITNLEIGKTIKVSELSYNNIELLDPKNTVVVRVKSARGVVAEETAAPGEAKTETAEK
ncbi:MAG: 50S ribosomal protein L25/general stress protein Ctc [Bacteroidetes bacterium GWF2_33_16]|nr:MAG: 50S ribosomal protein L25/general stress protein Ctc [Bacteroidetes bacterium GWE2_32_14]OFY08853.1 MAG: 50S ribosomal protein L25/general stress protein Ctc [Bacteroidetes bacterium GWF2_33_16]